MMFHHVFEQQLLSRLETRAKKPIPSQVDLQPLGGGAGGAAPRCREPRGRLPAVARLAFGGFRAWQSELDKVLGFDSFSILFNQRSFPKPDPFPLDLLSVFRKKDPWKEWGRYH